MKQNKNEKYKLILVNKLTHEQLKEIANQQGMKLSRLADNILSSHIKTILENQNGNRI
jgi:predicted DNA-binding ribbon-helix-helix protein